MCPWWCASCCKRIQASAGKYIFIQDGRGIIQSVSDNQATFFIYRQRRPYVGRSGAGKSDLTSKTSLLMSRFHPGPRRRNCPRLIRSRGCPMADSKPGSPRCNFVVLLKGQLKYRYSPRSMDTALFAPEVHAQ